MWDKGFRSLCQESWRLAILSTIAPEGEVGVVAAMVDLFLKDTPVQLSALEAAVALGNEPEVEELAHRLKGAASELGATALASVCADLEAVVHAGDLGRGPALVAQLHIELGRARDAFRVALPGTSSG